jgi:tubulin-like protein CetZ
MKLVVIGIGDCGSNVAAEFVRLGNKARAETGVDVLVRSYAINDDQALLNSLRKVGEKLLTIQLPAPEASNKNAEAGAYLMKTNGDRIIATMKAGEFFETDAFLLVASTAGCVGSGGISVLARKLKDRYVNKPVYALIVLPLSAESNIPICVYNTALCLKSIDKNADAVFLFDNEKVMSEASIKSAASNEVVNREIVAPFFDLLRASEKVDPKFLGTSNIGIGDIVQSLSGWSAIGYGTAQLTTGGFSLFKKSDNFESKGEETVKAMEAMSAALAHFSIECKLEDARKALYLMCMPSRNANINMTRAVGNRLRELTNNGEVRGGDFYGVKDYASVTLIASRINYLEKVKDYYERASSAVAEIKKRENPEP